MKRSACAVDEHRDPAKSFRFEHMFIADLGCAGLRGKDSCGQADPPSAGPAQSLSDDTQLRGYLPECNLSDVVHPAICTEGSPADESLCSGPATMLESPTPSPKPGRSAVGQDVLQIQIFESAIATASTGEVPAAKVSRCKRKVHFAPGPLEHNDSGDGHPVSSQVVRSMSNPYTPITYHPTEALTRHNLTAMENELGEDFKTENAASLIRLRRRLGIVPMQPIPRPYVTAQKSQQGARE